jgi:hypothetical protein
LQKVGTLDQKRRNQPHIFGPQLLTWKPGRHRWYNVLPKSLWTVLAFW